MKKLVGLVLLLCCLQFAIAGNKKSKNTLFGDKYFAVEDYFLAAEYYQSALADDPENTYIIYQLAECGRMFFDYKEAKDYYKKVVDLDVDNSPMALYYYAYMLKMTGEYAVAKDAFEQFLASHVNHETVIPGSKMQAILHLNGCIFALQELKKPIRDYEFQNPGLPFNSDESDFAPAFYKNDSSLAFASARISKKHEEIYGRLGGAFLDQYLIEKFDTVWIIVEDSDDENFHTINTKYHDAAGVFNNEKNKYYFTRCDDPIGDNEGFNCSIYITQKKGEKWKPAVKLNENVNVPGVWNAQPALSSGEDSLFFASKRDGGFGKSDIWMSTRKGNETENWTPAVNLGKNINTSGIDMSPSFYSKENVLFFASDGREGFGGLDVFMVRVGAMDTIRNVGLPFNSNADDFYFVLGEKKGFLSSNRSTSFGHDDLFGFDIDSKEALIAFIESDSIEGVDKITIRGRILDLEKNPAEGVVVLLLDSLRQEITRDTTNSDGRFVFENLDAHQDYRITLLQKNPSLTTELEYLVENVEIEGSDAQPTVLIDTAAQTITINGRIIDDNGEPRHGLEIVLVDKITGNELKTTSTDEDGHFMFANLDPDRQYKVMVRDGNNLVEYDYKNQNVQVIQNKRILNTASLKDAQKGIASRVLFENIYFDYNSSALSDQSIKVLNDLTAFLKEHPDVQLEIHGNTDNTGSNDYNLILGKKRGQSAYNYLVQKGAKKSDIVVNSFGEGTPVATNDSEIGRQLNRRVEFYINGGTQYQPKAMTYVITPSTSLSEVARKFGMSEKELKDMNGGDIDGTKPIRVRHADDQDVISKESLELAAKSDNPKQNVTIKDKTPSTTQTPTDVVYGDDDGSGFYVVLPKNTYYSIAKKFGVTIDQILAWNNSSLNKLSVGTVLQVKPKTSMSKESYMSKHSLADEGITSSDQFGEEVLVDGKKRYVVKSGDTFYTLSKRFGMTMEELKQLNNLDSFMLRQGMVLKVEK